MRDRILFFVLGALLATFAYFAGDMQLSAHNTEIGETQIIPELLVEELVVTKRVMVGFSDTYNIHITAHDKAAVITLGYPHRGERLGRKDQIAFVVSDRGTFISIRDETDKMRLMTSDLVDQHLKP